MSPAPNQKTGVGCLVPLAVAGLGISYWATGSLNPIQVYRAGNLVAKIGVSCLILFAGLVLLNIARTMASQDQDPAKMRNRSIGCMGILLLILLIVCYETIGSLNPLEVFYRGTTGAKVAVVLLGTPIVLSILGLLMSLLSYAAVYAPVKATLPKGQRVKDVKCSDTGLGCGGKALISFISAFGMPVQCSLCGRWWHQKCVRAAGGISAEGCPLDKRPEPQFPWLQRP